MKKLLALIILYSSFVIIHSSFFILCPRTKAQWEGAKVQRLTYNTSENRMLGLCIDKNDKLFLFYYQWWWDPYQQPYLDTLFLMTKEKNEGWSQPETISISYRMSATPKGVSYDPYSDLIHLFFEGGETLYYTNSSMPNWETVKTDSGSDRARVGGMAFDTLGNIHLVWNVVFDSLSSNWYKVMYANNSTGEWAKQQVSPSIWLGGMLPGPAYFDVQKNGVAHIAYQGEAICEAFYARNDGLNSSNWITDTIPKPSSPLWYYGASSIKVDVNDRVHLITVGCIEEDCVWPGLTRTFYYYKQAEDSVWQGPEQIPDTTFGARVGIDQLMIDKNGIPHASYFFSSNEEYFTDRRQGSWQVPYYLVGWHTTSAADSFMVDNFCFVLDSQGKGHGAFSAFNFAQGMFEDDSMEIYYLSSSSNSVVDTSHEHHPLDFSLFQNFPNPFNSSTIITYEIVEEEDVCLKIYDILGREVRELANTSQNPGHYKVIWDGKNNQGKEVSSGIYFCLLRAGERKEGRKMLFIK
jgi:hypothetical protein